MVHTPETIAEAMAHLTATEPAFVTVIDRLGPPPPRSSERGTAALLRTIVGQQVSVAAARSMWDKLVGAYGDPPDLQRLAAAPDEELRALGQSRQKAGYLRSLATLTLSGELNLDQLPADNEEAIALLTRVKGIGRWSAEIYLLFAEGRADVFPAGDLAVQIELGRLLGTEGKPAEKWLRARAESWAPYRGAAAVLAWHSYNTKVL
nr:DNA-3-methyladenine glycosylase 2 family protein [uncultured Sphingomonas sp.]